MVVDAPGRAYVGDFGFDLMGGARPGRRRRSKRVDPDGTVTVVAEDLRFPNGSVITPDGGTLIVGRDGRRPLHRVHIAADGSLSDRRVWAQSGRSRRWRLARGDAGPARGRAGRLHARRRGPHLGGRRVRRACAARRAGRRRSSTRSPAPDGIGVFACMLGGDDGRDAADVLRAGLRRAHRRRCARRCCSHRGRRPARRAAVTAA